MNKDQVLALFVDDTEARKKLISDYLKSDAPYEDRLEVLKKTPLYLRTHAPWNMHVEVDVEDIEWYDEFGIERRQVFFFGTSEVDEKDWSEEGKRVFYEEALSRGIHGFKHDW